MIEGDVTQQQHISDFKPTAALNITFLSFLLFYRCAMSAITLLYKVNIILYSVNAHCLAGFVAENRTINIPLASQVDPLPVMSVFGWIIFVQRISYTFDWQLNWADYKAGFGSIDADFWLGLEKVHQMTSSQAYRLRVEVQHRSTSLWYSAEYWSFKIGDELNDKYRLDVAGYSGDAGDSLAYEGDYNGDGYYGSYNHNGMKFTTQDQDNDLSTGNCAPNRGGGWWYNSCMWSCLTCYSSKLEWWTLGYTAYGRMMIKPQ